MESITFNNIEDTIKHYHDNDISKKFILEIDDLCKLFNIGKNTAYNLITSGSIAAFKIGTVWKIPMSSIEEYIKIMCENTKQELKIENKPELYRVIK